jgi:glyoxylase-like metal-dependent hydrolase (beta-lactamase superfamily II)
MFSQRTFSIFAMPMVLVACTKAPEPQPATAAEPTAALATTSSNVHAFKFGEFNAFALKDGTFIVPNDAKTIAVNRTPQDVATLLEASGAPTNELHLSIQPLLLRSKDKVMLFDTGAGTSAGDVAGKLIGSMREAGVEPSSVTDIFISHAHRDHVGGLFATDGLAFANATVHMSAPEWAFVKDSAADDAERAAMIKALQPNLQTFAPGADVVPGVVKAVDIKGHTPGHSGYLITSNADSLLYIGDSAHHYIVSVQEPDWTIQFDRDAPTAQASRKDLIASNAASHQRIYAVHFPFPGLGSFVAQGDGFVWSAEK